MKKLSYLLLLLFLYGCGWFDIKLDSDFEAPARYLDYMPDKTTIGANTFGCYEDGKLYAVQGPMQQEGEGSLWPGNLLINALLYKKTKMEIALKFC